VSGQGNAVFLSYASQDAEAAQRICEALRAGGIEVWFDQSELRGGEAWDQSIRKQIKTCALFIPVISHTTHDRREGYFRLEWKLAVDRCHLMDADMAFLMPVVIDDTRDDDERVPERFREVQWTRLQGGITPPAFVERVRRLLLGDLAQEPTRGASAAVCASAAPATRKPVLPLWRSKAALLVTIAVVVLALGYLVANRLVLSKHGAQLGAVPGSVAQRAPDTGFNPPPHSIAVLPFVNLSGDKEQEYFSDGLAEELLNSLSRINELQVAGRTSSFYFKGKDVDLGTIARKLNVGSVLEGSVRRSGNKIRVTTQLVNTVTGFHLWSETYDRDLKDVLKLQTNIAEAVTGSLRVALLGGFAEKIELGGTRNPSAFDAYLRGRRSVLQNTEKSQLDAIAEFSEAIRQDPNYALAFASRSRVFSYVAAGSTMRETFDKAHADAERAIALAPDLGEGHLALAVAYELGSLDFAKANDEFERALSLASGNVPTLWRYAHFAVRMGRTERAISAARRAVVLDPLQSIGQEFLASTLYYAREYSEAAAAFKEALALRPDYQLYKVGLGIVYYVLGDLQSARAACEDADESTGAESKQYCLAVTYDKLGRHADAEAMLTKLRASQGDADAILYANIYAQWGSTTKALEWLDTAVRLRASDLEGLKVSPLLDPLRKEPRFQAIERELKYPP
jgi:TolB-like protein/Tfp pilus assembly protein PilF